MDNKEMELIELSKKLIAQIDGIFSDNKYSLLDVIYVLSMTLYIFLSANKIPIDTFINVLKTAESHFNTDKKLDDEIQA